MDRRRFLPSAEGLEGRKLLSLLGGSTSSTNQSVSSSTLPDNFREKIQRIDRLPYYMEQFQPGRRLDPQATAQLQTDLKEIAGRLHAPSTQVVQGFNRDLRDAFPHSSLSRQTAQKLNEAFGAVLRLAGATAEQSANLQRDMNAIAQVDANGQDPTFLAANDYAVVLQTALSVGRPIRTPNAPALAAADGKTVSNGLAAISRTATPSFTGTYSAGATKDGFTTMQLLNESDQVLGTGVVDVNGRYTIPVASPLTQGIHHMRVRAFDELGHYSSPSPALMVKILPATPVAATPTSTVTAAVAPSPAETATPAPSPVATATPAPTTAAVNPFSVLAAP